MKQIFDSVKYGYCPLCHKENIYKVGSITYLSPTYYSNTPVSIFFEPELWRCRFCSSAFTQNAVSETESILLYQQGDATQRWSKSSFRESKTQVIIETLEHLFKKNARVLDVGCNTGSLLDFAKANGCQTFGVEYSLSSLAFLRQRGHTAYSNMEEADGLFDIITAFDLIEHLYDVPGFLNGCLNKLTKNGYLILLTGNINCFWSRFAGANWWYVRYPEHIIFPSRKYFNLHTEFEVIGWTGTYASLGYKQQKLSATKQIVRAILAGKYNGLPSLNSDHVLAVLKPKNIDGHVDRDCDRNQKSVF